MPRCWAQLLQLRNEPHYERVCISCLPAGPDSQYWRDTALVHSTVQYRIQYSLQYSGLRLGARRAPGPGLQLQSGVTLVTGQYKLS